MKQLVDQIKEIWCTTMHSEVMWPIHGHYQCRTCLREYPVLFAPRTARQAAPDERFSPSVALRRA